MLLGMQLVFCGCYERYNRMYIFSLMCVLQAKKIKNKKMKEREEKRSTLYSS